MGLADELGGTPQERFALAMQERLDALTDQARVARRLHAGCARRSDSPRAQVGALERAVAELRTEAARPRRPPANLLAFSALAAGVFAHTVEFMVVTAAHARRGERGEAHDATAAAVGAAALGAAAACASRGGGGGAGCKVALVTVVDGRIDGYAVRLRSPEGVVRVADALEAVAARLPAGAEVCELQAWWWRHAVAEWEFGAE